MTRSTSHCADPLSVGLRSHGYKLSGVERGRPGIGEVYLRIRQWPLELSHVASGGPEVPNGADWTHGLDDEPL